MSKKITFLLALVGALAVLAGVANAETPQYYPVNVWVGPLTELTGSTGETVSFDVYMTSTTATPQTNPAAVNMQSCDGSALHLARTRHLSNGEALTGGKGGPGATTALVWSRAMGAPADGRAASLHMTFTVTQPGGQFCLQIWDASEFAGGAYTRINLGMK